MNLPVEVETRFSGWFGFPHQWQNWLWGLEAETHGKRGDVRPR
jgi:hypothetical protein